MGSSRKTRQRGVGQLLLLSLLCGGCNVWGPPQVDPSAADEALDLAQDTPSDTPDGSPDVSPDEARDLPKDAPEDVPSDTPDAAPDAPLDMPTDAPQDVPEDAPQDEAADEPQDEEPDQPPVVLSPIYRLNTGGPSVVATGLNWAEDSKDNPSGCLNPAIQSEYGTPVPQMPFTKPQWLPEDVLYYERWAPERGELFYTFPVAAGQHEVVLIFAENFGEAMVAGWRVIDVTINGTQVLTAYDTYAKVGGYTADIYTFPVTTTGNEGVTVLMDSSASMSIRTARIQGIEIRSNRVALGCP